MLRSDYIIIIPKLPFPGGPCESQEAQVSGARAQGRGELPAEESGGGIR